MTLISADELTGPQKAALLLVQLGREQTAQVLRTMDDDEVETLMTEVAHLEHVHSSVMKQVVNEFISHAAARSSPSGGLGFVRDVLEEGLGRDRARRMMRRIDGTVRPFDFIKGVDNRLVLRFLIDEHPQTIALVLTHLEPDHAASMMAELPPELAGDVARRIGSMEQPPTDIVRQVENVLEQKLNALGAMAKQTTSAGVQPLVDILTKSTPEVEAAILERIAETDPALAEEVRRKLFVFEDIVNIDDRNVQLLLREIDSKDLATALKGVPEDVKDKVMRNLSERAAGNLAEEIDLLGPVRRTDVDQARDTVVGVIRSLESSGQIVLSRGGDAFVE